MYSLVVWEATPDQIQVSKQLFTANSAACHGEGGASNGVFADQLAPNSSAEAPAQTTGMQTQRPAPADFTDPRRMLSASLAHLQGKLIRGGMGTGMPYWRPIFTEDQTRALVAYLWTFQFQMEVAP